MNNKYHCLKPLLSFLLSACMLLSASVMVAVPAFAADDTKLDPTGWEATVFGEYTDGGWTKDKLFDGKTGMDNRWASGALQEPGQSISVDMKSPRTFNQIVMITDASDGGYARGYKIYVSNDGTNWGNPIVTGAGQNGSTTEVFSTQTAQYFKIELTESWGGGWWNIHELEVHYDPSLVVAAAVTIPDDVKGTAYEKPVSVLYSLGIMEGTSATTFLPDDEMTRAELTTVLVKMLGLDAQSAQGSTFGDVAPDHWAYSYIKLAADMGIVNGTGDNRFSPELPVSYTEAAKMVMCLLGYGPVAELSGGYPSGYLKLAAEKGVTDGITMPDGKFTRGMAARMIYNALEVEIMEQYGFGASEQYQTLEGRNLLERRDIYRGRGIVRGNDVTMLNGDSTLHDGEVQIDNTVYNAGGSGAASLLGCNIEFYVQQADDEDQGTLLYAAALDNRNEIIEVAARDIVSDTTRTRLHFTDAEDNMDEVSIRRDAYVIFNGKAKSNVQDEDFRPQAGSVRLIDNDADGIYDVADITSYINYVVSSVGLENMMINDKYNQPSLTLKDSNDFKYRIIDGDMGLKLESIKANMVLSVAADSVKIVDDKQVVDNDKLSYVTMYVSKATITGAVEEMTEDKGRPVVTIGGEEYRLAYNLDGVTPAIKLGTEGTFYLDVEGNIAGFDAVSNRNSYGILMGVRKQGGVSDDLEFKIFTDQGTTEVYTNAQKVRLNGNDTASEVEAVWGALDAYVKDNTAGGPAKLVMYHVNGAKEVDRISIPVDPDPTRPGSLRDENVLEQTGARAMDYRYRMETRTLKGEIFLNGSSKVFRIRIDDQGNVSTAEDAYSIADDSVFIHDRTYDVSHYNLSDEYVPEVICYYDREEFSVNYESGLMVVDRIVNTVDEEGQELKKVYGIFNGTADYGLTVAETVDVSKLQRGDFIMFSTNNKGEMSYVSERFDASVAPEDILGSNVGNYLSADQIATGRVEEIVGKVIKIDVSRTTADGTFDGSSIAYFNEFPSTMVYVFENDRVKVSAPANVEVGDMVVLRAKYSKPTEMLVIK